MTHLYTVRDTHHGQDAARDQPPTHRHPTKTYSLYAFRLRRLFSSGVMTTLSST